MMRKVALLVLAAPALLLAQGAPSISQTFKPGDKMHYYVTFQEPIQGAVQSLGVEFSLQGEAPKNQQGLPNYWWINQFHQISQNTFEVEGDVASVMTGTYRLQTVDLVLAGGGSRFYRYPADFKDEFTLSVQFPFPEIRSVSLSPPNP